MSDVLFGLVVLKVKGGFPDCIHKHRLSHGIKAKKTTRLCNYYKTQNGKGGQQTLSSEYLIAAPVQHPLFELLAPHPSPPCLAELVCCWLPAQGL